MSLLSDYKLLHVGIDLAAEDSTASGMAILCRFPWGKSIFTFSREMSQEKAEAKVKAIVDRWRAQQAARKVEMLVTFDECADIEATFRKLPTPKARPEVAGRKKGAQWKRERHSFGRSCK